MATDTIQFVHIQQMPTSKTSRYGGPTNHVDPNATPISLSKPAPVPLHWQEEVENDLNRDVAMDVLERVPLGEPTKWCFRMVVRRKDNGSPRLSTCPR